MYILRTEKQGGGNLMFMPFEIVSICVSLWYFFQKHAAYSQLHKHHMLGLHITDECLEQFFICFPTLLRMLMNKWGEGFSISLVGITFPWY